MSKETNSKKLTINERDQKLRDILYNLIEKAVTSTTRNISEVSQAVIEINRLDDNIPDDPDVKYPLNNGDWWL